MYDGLTPLFDHVTSGDLTTYFKSEAFGSLGSDGPGTPESVPHAGVTIVRDRFDVPHVKATTHAGGVWAAGWIAAEDRGLLLQQARYNARVAAIDAPGLSALGLISGLKSFVPSAQTEAVVARQTQVLKHAGKEGRAVLADIDSFIKGINAYLDASGSTNAHWTRNDVYSLDALKGQFVGQGGGDEARRSQFLGGLEKRLGAKKGFSVFNDLRQFKNAGSPTSIDGRFPYGRIPKRHPGSVVLDPGSFQPTPAARVGRSAAPPREPTQASNTLMITAKHSTNGHPLMVGGPQLGYYYPGLTYEIDMQAPRLHWRGATTAPFPGYMLIGRGPDFAITLTSADGDIIDQYAETLCGGSDERYRYKGRCREMRHFDAGTLNGQPVKFLTTVHGPVVGYATVHGRKVALASKRSSYGKDVLDLLFNRRISDGQVHSPKTFFDAAAKSPQTFNSYYIDNRHIAEYTSGRMPIRPPPGRPRPADQGHRAVRMAGVPVQQRAHARRRSEERQDRQLEQHRRPRLRCGRQQLGRKRLRRPGRSAQPQPRPAPQERQVEPGDGDLGDECLGDPGREGDRHRAAADEVAEGIDGAESPGPADARSAGRLAPARRQPPRQQPRRQDRRPGRGDHGRRLAADCQRLHEAADRAATR